MLWKIVNYSHYNLKAACLHWAPKPARCLQQAKDFLAHTHTHPNAFVTLHPQVQAGGSPFCFGMVSLDFPS